jgi:hypothetical protein
MIIHSISIADGEWPKEQRFRTFIEHGDKDSPA